MSQPVLDLVTSSLSRQGSGVAEAVRQAGQSLVEDGVFVVRAVTARDCDFAADCRWASGPVIEAFRFFGPQSFRISPGLFWRVFTSGADVIAVHGLWAFHGFAVLAWHLRTGRRYVVVPHGMLDPWVRKRSPWLKMLVGWVYQDVLLRRAAAFHVLTEKEAADVRAVLPAARCFVIPNGVADADHAAEKPLWFDDSMVGRRIYLFFARIHDQKGWRELCTAWRLLCAAEPGFAGRSQLVFCGWLDRAPDFERTIADLAAEFGNVIHAGPQYGVDKVRSLQAADVVILPSKFEGLPMTVLDAWSHGKPVLMTEQCNLQVGFEHGAALRISGDVEGIADGLLQASRWDRERMHRMGSAGRDLVARAFAAPVIAARTRAMLEDVLARAR